MSTCAKLHWLPNEHRLILSKNWTLFENPSHFTMLDKIQILLFDRCMGKCMWQTHKLFPKLNLFNTVNFVSFRLLDCVCTGSQNIHISKLAVAYAWMRNQNWSCILIRSVAWTEIKKNVCSQSRQNFEWHLLHMCSTFRAAVPTVCLRVSVYPIRCMHSYTSSPCAHWREPASQASHRFECVCVCLCVYGICAWAR